MSKLINIFFALVLPCACMLEASASAQRMGWRQLTTAHAPSGRSEHAMAFDAARQRVVLFGGMDDDALLPCFPVIIRALLHDDTWEWDGSDWVLRAPATGPSPRHGHAMAYDKQRRRVVLFGGRTYGCPPEPSPPGIDLADTWEWDGVSWQLRTPPQSPFPRAYSAMVYDEARATCLLFGGSYGGSETWSWDGASWNRLTPVSSPPPMQRAAMANDPVSSKVVLTTDSGDETWEWDGGTWTRVATDAPSLFRGPATWDDGRRVVFREDEALDWTWQNGAWQRRALRKTLFGSGNILRVAAASGAFGFGNRKTVSFLPSFAHTYEYAVWPPSPGSYGSLGQGCPGSAGTPSLTPRSEPWVGEMFTMDLTNLRPTPPNGTFVVLGFSKVAWGTIGLPLDLGLLGMPHCWLYVSGDHAVPLVNTGGTATWSIFIPDETSLIGAGFFNQAVVEDPGTNAWGAVVSNAGEATIGAR